MKRELKFRVWDKAIKAFISNTGNPNIFPFNGRIGMTCNGNSTGHINTDDWMQEQYILMQFTGLKDKNGKEIWEGDITEAILNYHGQETDTKFNAKIIYNDDIGAFQISYKNIDDHFVSDTIYSRYFLKVIGNIYENPELINK